MFKKMLLVLMLVLLARVGYAEMFIDKPITVKANSEREKTIYFKGVRMPVKIITVATFTEDKMGDIDTISVFVEWKKCIVITEDDRMYFYSYPKGELLKIKAYPYEIRVIK